MAHTTSRITIAQADLYAWPK